MNQQYIILPLCMAREIGLNESIVLNQLYYCQKKSKHSWICSPYAEWKKQLCFWSNRTIQRVFLSLEKKGIIESKKTRISKIYRIPEESIKKFFPESKVPKCHPVHANLAQGIYEVSKEDIKKTLSTPLNSSSSDILRELIKIWNEKIAQDGQKLNLSKQREKRLQAVFAKYFNSEIQKWESFVNLIVQSNFLMGKVKDFRANFDWAIQEPYINRILEGAYNNKTNNEQVSSETQKRKIKIVVDEIFASVTDPIWRNVLLEIQEYDGPAGIYSWFKDVSYERLGENVFSIKATSVFKRDYINVRYMGRIRSAIAKTTGIMHPVIKMNT